MTGATIAQLIVAVGLPLALDLIRTLQATWSKPMTPAEVDAALAVIEKSYNDYAREAEAKLAARG